MPLAQTNQLDDGRLTQVLDIGIATDNAKADLGSQAVTEAGCRIAHCFGRAQDDKLTIIVDRRREWKALGLMKPALNPTIQSSIRAEVRDALREFDLRDGRARHVGSGQWQTGTASPVPLS
jgi:hypothetical protein